MLNIKIQNITDDSCCSYTKLVYSDWYSFITVNTNTRERERPCKSFQRNFYAATPPLRLSPTSNPNFSLWVSKLNSPNFQILWFLYMIYFNYLLYHTFYNHPMCHKPIFPDADWQALICLLSISYLPQRYFDMRC